jgi:hypothetical protein
MSRLQVLQSWHRLTVSPAGLVGYSAWVTSMPSAPLISSVLIVATELGEYQIKQEPAPVLLIVGCLERGYPR